MSAKAQTEVERLRAVLVAKFEEAEGLRAEVGRLRALIRRNVPREISEAQATEMARWNAPFEHPEDFS